MKLRYSTRKLEKSVESFSVIKKNYGEWAKKVVLRLEQLSQAPNLAAMRTVPSAHCHELKADKISELAVDISPNHRILFQPAHNPIPLKDDGGLDWREVTCIIITAIGEDYH